MEKYHSVIFIMYDLPVKKTEERKRAGRFRRDIKRMGYQCIQESVYVKLINNVKSVKNEIKNIEDKAPKIGNVRAFSMTVSDFRNIKTISGENLRMDYLTDDIIIV